MPIRVIGYFPTVRVTNDETVKIRKVGYQGPAGRPASDFNFSELANVADSAAPTLGNIPCGDGTLWQSVALTPALAGADPTGSAAAAQAVAIAAAATRSDNASNLSTGTVPLGRLAGITNAQLSATAGILSSQIAGLDASKITGTFPLSLLNQGTTGQFLRGDGAYSNTLTGGLTIAGALAGATTGTFSTSVATPLLAPAVASAGINVSDNLNFTTSQAIDGTKFAFGRTTGGNMFLNTTAGLSFGVYIAGTVKSVLGETSSFFGTGGVTFGGASSTALSTSQIGLGSRISGRLNLGGGATSVVQEIGGAAVTTVSSTGLAVTGNMAASGAVSGTNLYVSSGNVFGVNTLSGSDTGTCSLSGCNTINNARAGYVQVFGINNANVGNVNIRPANSVGAQLNLIYPTVGQAALRITNTQVIIQTTDGTQVANFSSSLSQFLFAGIAKLNITSAAVTVAGATPLVFGSSGTTTAANNEIVGAVGGLRYNVASGLSHTLLVANTAALTLNSTTATFSGTLTATAITGTTGTFSGLVKLGGTAPATASSTGTAGQIAWDPSGNIYICSATNTWRRVATSTF